MGGSPNSTLPKRSSAKSCGANGRCAEPAEVRIFLDANILFSATKSEGFVRRLLDLLVADGHTSAPMLMSPKERAASWRRKARPDCWRCKRGSIGLRSRRYTPIQRRSRLPPHYRKKIAPC
jgi:hypothetical protein